MSTLPCHPLQASSHSESVGKIGTLIQHNAMFLGPAGVSSTNTASIRRAVLAQLSHVTNRRRNNRPQQTASRAFNAVYQKRAHEAKNVLDKRNIAVVTTDSRFRHRSTKPNHFFHLIKTTVAAIDRRCFHVGARRFEKLSRINLYFLTIALCLCSLLLGFLRTNRADGLSASNATRRCGRIRIRTFSDSVTFQLQEFCCIQKTT